MIYHDLANNSVTNIIILGDFNLADINWNTFTGKFPMSQQFCEMIFDFGLCQLINFPTHNKGNILDLLITNMEDNIDLINVHSQHQIIMVQLLI